MTYKITSLDQNLQHMLYAGIGGDGAGIGGSIDS